MNCTFISAALEARAVVPRCQARSSGGRQSAPSKENLDGDVRLPVLTIIRPCMEEGASFPNTRHEYKKKPCKKNPIQ